MMKKHLKFLLAVLLLAVAPAGFCLEFLYMTDLHFYQDKVPEAGFRKLAARILGIGAGDFLITGGDYDNFPEAEAAVSRYLLEPLARQGRTYAWYVVVGNHEPEGNANEKQRNCDGSGRNIRRIIARNSAVPGIVNRGPQSHSGLAEYQPDRAGCTTFSFDYEQCHFIILDLYSAQTPEQSWQGQVDQALLEWVREDLRRTGQKYIFVFAHEPLKQFDGIKRWQEGARSCGEINCAAGESNALWECLKADDRVVAYVCGHTHSFGVLPAGRLYQLGIGEALIEHEMFVKFIIEGDDITARIYRTEDAGEVITDCKLR